MDRIGHQGKEYGTKSGDSIDCELEHVTDHAKSMGPAGYATCAESGVRCETWTIGSGTKQSTWRMKGD